MELWLVAGQIMPPQKRKSGGGAGDGKTAKSNKVTVVDSEKIMAQYPHIGEICKLYSSCTK